MERDGQTTSSGPNGVGDERGAGGKARKPPSRKPTSTPYSRPPPSQSQDQAGGRRWLSKLVDPAYRLLSSGATRILPSLFSKPTSVHALPSSASQDRQNLHAEVEEDGVPDHAKSTLNHGPSRSTMVAGPSRSADRLKSCSDCDDHKLEQKADLSDDIRLSEIEKLMKERKFSREEANRLAEILHSRAVDLNPEMTEGRETPGAVVAFKTPRASLQGKDSRAQWVGDEVGASPVEIARAYMGNRASEISLGAKNKASEDEIALLHGDVSAAKPFIPSPLPKPSACWPGAMAQDRHGYLTPQTHRNRYDLHNFPRTPYSRTIFSKSKTRVAQLRGDGDRVLNISSTPLQQTQTPIYGQVKRTDALDSGYGSVGPIRRTSHKPLAKSSSRGSIYSRSSLDGPSQAENSNLSEGFFPATKKSMEFGGTSGISNSQLLYSKPRSSESKDRIDQNSHLKVPPQESTSEATDAVKKGSSASSVTKPVLPSISVSKPDSRWSFASDTSSAFTFPVSSSVVEPPTPTIVPTFSGGGLQQPKEGPALPSYSFGSKRSAPALVFSLPSTSSANIHEEALGIKYSFGSDENKRLSFSAFEKDAICY
ncbi:hypothetical protein CJ030_MR0G024301 [Morella rubra]|uniref:Nuclear pore complex protein NUP1 n=1 Tax=Morella rubra TaxID=262757 RepID=A0A6A1UFN7_9ROSI|nr:hypothetical protein CJ030_MR0G024295 [Morella rubra]KAB1199410.1 hypothetical protein CJ030_MR0G024301 [Morella rubra]